MRGHVEHLPIIMVLSREVAYIYPILIRVDQTTPQLEVLGRGREQLLIHHHQRLELNLLLQTDYDVLIRFTTFSQKVTICIYNK